MSIRRPLRGAALEIAEAVKACRAAADRGDSRLARELEHKLYLRTLRLIANGSKRAQRLAFTALSVASVLGERFGPAALAPVPPAGFPRVGLVSVWTCTTSTDLFAVLEDEEQRASRERSAELGFPRILRCPWCGDPAREMAR